MGLMCMNKREYKQTPVHHFITVFRPHAFRVGAFWGMEIVDYLTALRTL